MKSRSGVRLVVCLICTIAAGAVRGELTLTNFSSTNLMKVMPVGDSITDDCSTNGAWRLFLQPLLDGNGIVFTNTGRNLSTFVTGFTKRKHEGYCGAVIGPPGVFGPVYFYNATDNYLQKIAGDALRITNNRPDLMLILIGANDIGHGRDPWMVATNDMPILLSVIFSNVPNANVVLTKITTLQDATAGYNWYATNVTIYNAALQWMVNQRRALGQNVFLADMFSAVDYSTMFMSDHLHPNPLGLKAIATEWAARIETILIRTNRSTRVYINGGADWKYSDLGQDLGTNWAQPGYDDSGWSHGIARLGYGDPATATTVNFGADPTNKFTTTYFRNYFVVPWNMVVTNLNFRLACADGAVVWLNGQEVFRTNMPAGPLSYTSPALGPRIGFTPHIFYPTNINVLAAVPTGTNLLAVEVHLSSPTNSTLGFDMELIGIGSVLPNPSLSISPAGTNLLLSWPATNGGTFTLLTTTNPGSGNWITSSAYIQTNGGQVVVTQLPAANLEFFRLQRPYP